MASVRPKRPKAPPPRLDLDEMENDPSMKGMLSFLEVTPEEKLEMLRRRAQVDASSVIPFPARAAGGQEAKSHLAAVRAAQPAAQTDLLPETVTGTDVGELAGPQISHDNAWSFEHRHPDHNSQEGAPTFGALRSGAPNEEAEAEAADIASREQFPVRIGAPTSGAPSVGALSIGAPSFGVLDDKASATAPEDGDVVDLLAFNGNIKIGVDAENPIAMTSGAPTSGAPNSGAPNSGTLISGAPLADAPNHDPRETVARSLGVPSISAITGTAPTFGAPEVGAPKFGAPELGEVFVYHPVRPSLHPAITAQDAHTHGEQALFATLWRLARPHPKGTFRAISIGERSLAKEVPMAYSSVQENLRSLEKKLAIEVRISGLRQPKTYVVYAYEEILRRRRTAGLTHVIRRTSGVSLVNPEQMAGAPNLGAPEVNSGAPSVGAPRDDIGAPSLGRSGAPNLGATIRNKEILFSGTSTSSGTWPLALGALIDSVGHGDDDAVRRMADAAIANAPDMTDAELAYFIRDEAGRIIRNKSIENPTGLLIRQVPRRFVGETFRLFREARTREQQAAEASRRVQLEEARQILANPDSHPADREWAQHILSL